MSNEWKVCTLEQAKRLVELGVKLKTQWIWWDEKGMDPGIMIDVCLWSKYASSYPAPDVAELSKATPHRSRNNVIKYKDTWFAWELEFKTEAQALCANLIWSIEEGDLKAKDLKL